jgi:hypothetical protein
MEGSDPEVAFVVPIAVAVFILIAPIFLRQGLGWKRFPAVFQIAQPWAKVIAVAELLYIVAIMIYMAVTFHGGGPVIHHGVGMIWFKSENRYAHVSPEVYHRAVAVVLLFISAWGTLAFAGIASIYHRWLLEVLEPTGWSRAPSEGAPDLIYRA